MLQNIDGAREGEEKNKEDKSRSETKMLVRF